SQSPWRPASSYPPATAASCRTAALSRPRSDPPLPAQPAAHALLQEHWVHASTRPLDSPQPAHTMIPSSSARLHVQSHSERLALETESSLHPCTSLPKRPSVRASPQAAALSFP